MRRITAVLVGALAVAGLALTAGTAFAADGSTPADPSPSHDRAPVTIHLACTQDGTQITCSWDPADGAASYRVGETYRHGHAGAFQVKKTTDTSVTFDATHAGHYRFVVQALDAGNKVIARSNKVKVTVAKTGTKKAPAPSPAAPAPAA